MKKKKENFLAMDGGKSSKSLPKIGPKAAPPVKPQKKKTHKKM